MTTDLVLLRSQFDGGAAAIAVPPHIAEELLRPERDGFFWRDGERRPADRVDPPKGKAHKGRA